MKRIISLILVVVLCLALSVSAFAAGSNQADAGCGCCLDCDGSCTGDCCAACEMEAGNASKPGTSPKTGSVALAALALTACTAGGISVVTGRKAK